MNIIITILLFITIAHIWNYANISMLKYKIRKLEEELKQERLDHTKDAKNFLDICNLYNMGEKWKLY